MSQIEWEVNNSSIVYRTKDGNISVQLQIGDKVTLHKDGWEYVVTVNPFKNIIDILEGVVNSSHDVNEVKKSVVDNGATVKFKFKNIFTVAQN